ncbi:4-(cytidine 5'-diphospho)-2-C-methyl-D-erythritol kinase [Fusibacter sp. JL216-2]|uniref:4-(cytidine 5'-diphospho)-2-C-methyl-D-erythritol kinase n=1 Tax=Fusibacter sp. JL216-2 TaxID=3071453 RepID=UPI003D32E58C
METVSLRAYAKINLTLDVTGKRENGYHDVRMVMQQIDLHDTVILTKLESGIELETNSAFLPTDESNIAWKAAQAVSEHVGRNLGVKIYIDKKIPVAAGLAGGSTDAAAVIRGLNKLYHLGLSLETMMKIGVTIGADVPFCIMGGTAIAEGIGEELTKIEPEKSLWMVLSKPGVGVSTKRIYTALDYKKINNHPETESMIEAVKCGDIGEISLLLGNVLEPVTLSLYPSVGSLKSKMKEYGACGSLMSGSGPSVFGLFKSYEKACTAAKRLKRVYKQTFVTKTIIGGYENEW